jgi:crotonobetainyl-CoA:carnitine CoA-transferase CaiB-like acyl-CoA transferase
VPGHPQLAHRGVLRTTQTPFGPVTPAGPAFRFARGGGRIDGPLATPGMHNDEVLAELGHDAAAIAALREAGAVT